MLGYLITAAGIVLLYLFFGVFLLLTELRDGVIRKNDYYLMVLIVVAWPWMVK